METGLRICSAFAFATAAACANGSSTTVPGGNSGSGFDGAAVLPLGDGGVVIAPDNLIDDLDDGDGSIAELNGRVGAWYTYNDESASGQQAPDPKGDFTPTPGGLSDGGFMARTSGSGFTEWGAGMGFDLNNPGDAKGVWDASSYTGLAFFARGDVAVRVAVVVQAVVPTDAGGTCTAGTSEGEECDDAHGRTLVLGDPWQQYLVPFDDIAQNGWGKPATFDAATVTSVQFQLPAGSSFDIAVDEIGFY